MNASKLQAQTLLQRNLAGNEFVKQESDGTSAFAMLLQNRKFEMPENKRFQDLNARPMADRNIKAKKEGMNKSQDPMLQYGMKNASSNFKRRASISENAQTIQENTDISVKQEQDQKLFEFESGKSKAELKSELKSDLTDDHKLEGVKPLEEAIEDLSKGNEVLVQAFIPLLKEIENLLGEMNVNEELKPALELEIANLSENIELLSQLDGENALLAEDFKVILDAAKLMSTPDASGGKHEISASLLKELNAQLVSFIAKQEIQDSHAIDVNLNVSAELEPEAAELVNTDGASDLSGEMMQGKMLSPDMSSDDLQEVADEELETEFKFGSDIVDTMRLNTGDIKLKNVATLQRSADIQEIYSQIKAGVSKLDLSTVNGELVIKLKPEELGKVDLRIEMHNNVLVAKFDVENQSVKAAIESNLKDLRSSLEERGFSNMQLDVNVGQGDKSGVDHQNMYHYNRARTNTTIELNSEIELMQKSLTSIVGESTFEHLA